MPLYSLQTPALIQPALSQGILSVNASALPMLVAADLNTGVIVVSISQTNETYTLSSYTTVTSGGITRRQFSGSIPLPGTAGSYTLNLVAQDVATSPSHMSPVATITVIVADMGGVAVAYPPASVQVLQLYDRVRIRWANVTTPGFLGVRVQTSTDSSGVTVPYAQFGTLVANNNTSSETVLIASSKQTQLSALSLSASSQKTVTVQETLQLVTYSSVDIMRTAIGADQFFALASTMVQDPDTQQVYESVASGPFTCSFVNLSQVSPADFPPTTQPEQIAGGIIGLIAQEYGGLDQSPRSETRDLQVDPFALELSNATIRSWFTRVSSSLSALVAIDDANGDGVSDPAAASQVKQAIARAFRVTDAQVQVLIDNQFNVQAEPAGITRLGPQAAIIPVTFYVQSAPKDRITVQLGSIVATVPDATTASATYTTLESGMLDPANLNAYWIPALSGWGFTLNCQCTMPGSLGSVGAGTIRTVISGASAAMLCSNLTTATLPGQDQETNAALAARVQQKRVTGIDSGTAGGYYSTAMACAGVIGAAVVQAGDLEMLRDWDPLRLRHTFGCVDIYARGGNYSQVTQDTPYTLQTSGTLGVLGSYTPLTFAGLSGSRIKFTVPSGLPYDVAAISEIWLNRAGGVYLGVQTAMWDPQSGAIYLNPNDLSYSYNSDGTTSTGASNLTWLTGLAGVSVLGLFRYWSPLEISPSQEPVQNVSSIIGNGNTGALPSSGIILDKTGSDPLLTGNSNRASDSISFLDTLTTVNTQLTWATNGLLVLDLGEGVYVPTIEVDNITGVPRPGNILSLRSQDSSVLYSLGVDYELVVLGPYNHFGISRLSGSAILLDKPVQLAYQAYQLAEQPTLRTDQITLSGSTAVPLNFPGYVSGVRMPVSHGMTTLALDSDLVAAQVGYLKRYIKVFVTDLETSLNTVYLEGADFTLAVDPVLGPTLSKFVSGNTSPSRIADNTVLTVQYYTVEVFTTAYSYPEFLTQLNTAISASKHGGADDLAKAMMANAVDMNFTVTLVNSPTTTPAIIDPMVRTAVSLAVSMAQGQLGQDDVVYLIKAIPGVKRVNLPLTRFAKADGSYILGEVVPTGTVWVSPSTLYLPEGLFPVQASAWVTAVPVLSCSTCPSGAAPNAFAGLLYEGQSYRRCLSLTEFSQATDLAFYIIGVNDAINPTAPVASQHAGKLLLNTQGTAASPTLLPYRVTYQVFGEASAQDISISSLEYLIPGQISIAYEIEGQ
jgi:hypothetical protein